MNRQTVTVKEASTYIGVSKDLIYQLVKENKLPHLKLGRRILFRKNSLDTWMLEQEKTSLKPEKGIDTICLNEFSKSKQ
ncbi:helix-turn-helix domain-containing protein [Priestia aryabhattai]|uniref:helix-turn-helix domain-containing protein n=1 Tax=Priestia aryabhattai TaxID=412384 RepID=UPI0035ABC23A